MNAVAFSPDGQYFISGSGDNSVRLWHRATVIAVKKYEGHSGSVNAVAFSPDGQYFISGSGDKTIHLWDRVSGDLVTKYEGHTGSVNAVAFSPDGESIVTGSGDNTIRLWDRASSRLIRKINSLTDLIFKDLNIKGVHAVAFSPDGQYIVSGGSGKLVSVWDQAKGNLVRRYDGHSSSVHSVAFSPDGQYLISGSADKTICLWDWGRENSVTKFGGNVSNVNSVAISNDNQHIISSHEDNTVRLWDRATGSLVKAFEKHNDSVHSVAFSSDGQYFVSGSRDKTIRLWDRVSGKQIKKYKGHTSGVLSTTFDHHGKYVVSGSGDNTIRLWDRDSGKQLKKFEGEFLSVHSVAFSPDSQYIVSGSGDNTIRLWNSGSGRLVRKIEGHTSSVNAVAFSPDGQCIVSGSADNTVRLWDQATNSMERKFEGHTGSVNAVAFSPDSQYIVSGSADNTIRLWDWAFDKMVRKFEGHTGSVNSVAFSPDGQFIISASQDFSIKLWNRETGKLLGTIVAFKDGEWIAYTPDKYYNSSLKGDQYMTFRVENRIFEFSQYADLYNRQKLTSLILNNEEIKTPVAQIIKETGVDLLNVKVAEIPPPELNIHYLDVGGLKKKPESQNVSFSEIILHGSVREHRFGVENIRITLNGEEIYKEENIGKKDYQFRIPVVLKDFDNKLNMLASSTKKVRSYPWEINLSYEEAFPNGKTLPEIAKNYFGSSRSWAVIIGINNYSHDKGFDCLSYAVDDANSVKEFLVNSLDFSEDKIFTLKNEEATKVAIEKLLGDELPRKVKENDRVILFFSGHGETMTTRKGKEYGYLIPVDGDEKSLHATSISMTDMIDWSNLIPAKHMLFLIDACYDGVAGKRRKGRINKETVKQVETFIKSDGRQIMTAGTSRESIMLSNKWNKHSVYTYYLLEGLRGEADRNGDRVITVNELQFYLGSNLIAEANQTPQLHFLGSGKGQFVFYREESIQKSVEPLSPVNGPVSTAEHKVPQ